MTHIIKDISLRIEPYESTLNLMKKVNNPNDNTNIYHLSNIISELKAIQNLLINENKGNRV